MTRLLTERYPDSLHVPNRLHPLPSGERTGPRLARLAAILLGAAFALPYAVGATAAVTEPLTHGPGNHTEASCSPDGKTVAFQTDQSGNLDIMLLDLESGSVKPLVTGPEHACFPEWSADGKTVFYAQAYFTKTAAEATQTECGEGYHLFAIPAAGGKTVQITEGRLRDYAPTVTPDGTTLLFASSRGSTQTGAGIQTLRLTEKQPRPFVAAGGQSVGAVEPDVSPDGRLVAYAESLGFRANWRIWLADIKQPAVRLPVTPMNGAFYAPRWSPDGRMIACTGYRPGDPGWGIVILNVPTGASARIETGNGNARSPDWSPDGKWIVYEANRSGTYKLYRTPALIPESPPEVPRRHWRTDPILKLDFSSPPGAEVANRVNPADRIPVPASIPRGPGAGLRLGNGFLQLKNTRPFAFGTDPFYVTISLEVESHSGELRIVAVGDYPQHHLGWQIFINSQNLLYFNARTPGGSFVGAHTDNPLPTGKPVTVTGVRGPDGSVELFLDQTAQRSAGSGATMDYQEPTQIRIGTQFNGSNPFNGLIHRIEIGRGLPAVKTRFILDLNAFYP